MEGDAECPSSLPTTWAKGEDGDAEPDTYRGSHDSNGDPPDCTIPTALGAAQVQVARVMDAGVVGWAVGGQVWRVAGAREREIRAAQVWWAAGKGKFMCSGFHVWRNSCVSGFRCGRIQVWGIQVWRESK